MQNRYAYEDPPACVERDARRSAVLAMLRGRVMCRPLETGHPMDPPLGKNHQSQRGNGKKSMSALFTSRK